MTNLESHTSNLKYKEAYAVIVAGGSGSRMQSAVPKQFLEICGKPVLMHTINAFYKSTFEPKIILVLNATYHDYWWELCEKHQFDIEHQLIAGGETRFHSVKNAVDIIENEDALIAVHDAVRPLTDIEVINNAYQTAQSNGSAITAVKSRDSIRQMTGITSVALRREDIYLVQTPQTFKAGLLKQAYEQPYSDYFTDDASVVEQAGHTVHLIEGNYTNIKITFPEDIAIAELLLNKKGPQL
ncbi:2-C-methyl-D-erythritol 4-phosphate cytidylyltransferase [Mucilaginibacter pallidiroseus]|uniref:2-C-methyl-D-erythritol 4-phosphate cytidylyltransferase n=1 Tax=Mucilaginibacter pallidiroseus TaxID=2599295 RepID=A0A563UCK5_9SPHI|nr:2-C-methyl-D-erythritol 4-phosphate cytidylyltransferase [Mucilaginibacter pallidiroseus]TWR29064.1 2-C-methyl-D-erythritol 4-phosphate cytidylyltransferase [Mucilaginibacter pallidiroseus]